MNNPICDCCGSSETKQIYASAFGVIFICFGCGLVFRHGGESSKNIYTDYDKMLIGAHLERFKNTTKFLSNPSIKKECCLDIGSATGDFVKLLSGCGAVVETAIESSAPLIAKLAKNIPKTNIFNGYVDAYQTDKKYDLITALGCVYLFKNQSATLQKINLLLRPGGLFYFDCNAFVDMRSFVGRNNSVTTARQLFDSSCMLRWWFTESGLRQQVDKYFSITGELKALYNGVYFLGLLCEKRMVENKYVPQPENVTYVKETLNKLGIIL